MLNELPEAFLEPSEAESLLRNYLNWTGNRKKFLSWGKSIQYQGLPIGFQENKSYIYSGIKVEPEPFPQSIEDLCLKIEETSGKI